MEVDSVAGIKGVKRFKKGKGKSKRKGWDGWGFGAGVGKTGSG